VPTTPDSPAASGATTSEVDAAFRHFMENVRLRLENDPMDAISAWSDLYTEAARRGLHDACDELLAMVKRLPLPPQAEVVVWYAQGWMYDRSGRWEQAIRAYETALMVAAEAGLSLESELRCQIGSLYQDQGHWDRAGQEYARALDLATTEPQRAKLLNNLGNLHMLRDHNDEALRYFDEAREIFTTTGDKINYAAAGVGQAGILRDQGRLQDSVNKLVESIMIFRDLSQPKPLAAAIASLASTYHVADRLKEAAATYQTSLEVSMNTEDLATTAKTLGNLAMVWADAGKLDEALGHLKQAHAEYTALGDRHGVELAEANIARLAERRAHQTKWVEP
jgi:tetratricopeptide (TPR) repeat protein